MNFIRYCILGILSNILIIEYLIFNYFFVISLNKKQFFCEQKKSNVESKLDTFRKRNTNLIPKMIKGNKFKNKLNNFNVTN